MHGLCILSDEGGLQKYGGVDLCMRKIHLRTCEAGHESSLIV